MSTERFIADLDASLASAGIHGSRRRRIVAEFTDHLAEDPRAELGDPTQIAIQFADELGTSFARGAAYRSFAALAVAGLLIVVRLLTMGPFNRTDGSVLDTLGILAAVVAAQVAFAAGVLALLRGWRLRDRPTIARAEARVLARRAGTGLVACAVATIALPLRAAATPHISSGSSVLAVATMVASLVALALAVPGVVQAVRVRPLSDPDRPAGDLLADLGPIAQPIGTPTRFAILLAVGLAAVVTIGGIVGDDPYDGAARGLLEGGACLAGFGVLGRYLGLRR